MLALQHPTTPQGKRTRDTNLSPCALAANGQAERMATTTVGTSLLQALNVIQNLSTQVVLNLHVG